MSRSFFAHGYTICLALATLIATYSVVRPQSLMPLGRLVDLVTYKRATRFGLLVFWFWFGVHYLGR